jgi:hypothetical protein
MNQSQKKALSYLTGYDDFDSVPVETLTKLAEEDPYFAVGQYLLAKKLKVEHADDFPLQAQKTALFFSNSLWLDYQLNADVPEISTATNTTIENALASNQLEYDKKELAPIINETSDEVNSNGIQENTNQTGGRNEEIVEENVEVQPAEENEIIVGVTEAQTEPLPDQLDENLEKTIHPNLEETLTETPIETKRDSDSESRTDVPKVIKDQTEEEIAATTRNTDAPAEQFLEQLDETTIPVVHTDSENIFDNASAKAQLETVEFAEEMAGVSNNVDKATETFLQEVEPITVDQAGDFDEGDPDNTDLPLEDNLIANKLPEVKPEQDEHERMFLNIKAMLDATSEEANAETKEAYVPIDPYYTIDYFASQGIKLDLDQNPNDQLGRNLKKFTQWLKHMKKLGPEDALETMKGAETESDIQQIADSSNVIKEVVTEAMASVLEKQGKKDKAIELYNKLSFLNPDKSAYFANKIKNLKGF